MEQRMNTKFCLKLSKSPTEAYGMLQTVCDDEALRCSSVFEWFKRFKDGREDLLDNPKSGSPSTSRNAYTTANVREMVTLDPLWDLKATTHQGNWQPQRNRNFRELLSA
jgi:hypothetical protein